MGFLAAFFFGIVMWFFGAFLGLKAERDGWVKATGSPTAEAYAAKHGVLRTVMTGNDAA